MVVGPEYNAIMGVALAPDKRARRPVLRGLLALLVGFTAAMAVTLLFGLAIRWSGHTPKLYSIGIRPVSDLINNLNVFSVVVAVSEARGSAFQLLLNVALLIVVGGNHHRPQPTRGSSRRSRLPAWWLVNRPVTACPGRPACSL